MRLNQHYHTPLQKFQQSADAVEEGVEETGVAVEDVELEVVKHQPLQRHQDK